MSFANFIPQVYSATLYENLNDVHVYAALLSRDYEGEIKKQGDSVRVHTIGRITNSPYTKGSTTITRQNPVGATQVMSVDQAHYFAYDMDDIDILQTKPELLDKYLAEAAWGLADTVDNDIAAVLKAGVAAANVLADVDLAGDTNFVKGYQALVDLSVVLTKNNVPRQGRWAVAPPEFEGFLLKDNRFVGYGTADSNTRLANGKIGRIAGFDIHISNNVPTGDGGNPLIIAGVSSAAGYVEQINKVEPYRPEDSFEDAVKGLLVYGRKVFDGTRLAAVEVDVTV